MTPNPFILIIFFVFVILLVVSIVLLYITCSHRENWDDQTSDEESIQKLFHRYIKSDMNIVMKRFLEQLDNMKYVHSFLKSYSKQVEAGKKHLKKSDVVIAGLMRNCTQNIPHLKVFFDRMKKACRKCSMVIVENDSHDGTRALLYQWKQEEDNIVILCPTKETENNECITTMYSAFGDKSPSHERIKKMAALRNLYLRYVQQHYGHYHYLLVLDMDLQGHLYWDGFLHSCYHMSKNRHYDAIACNGMMVMENEWYVYYDSFAYVPLHEEGEWKTIFDKRSHDDDVVKYVTIKYLNAETGVELDQVVSAFGGMCFYRMSSLRHKTYGYSPTSYICEHTMLHRKLKYVYVNPRMLFLVYSNLT